MAAAQAYERIGRIEEASDLLAHAARLSHGNSKALSLSAYVMATAGRVGEAREVLDQLEDRARDAYVPPVAVALGYLGLNDEGQVLVWLERALAVRDVHLIYVPWDGKWERLRRKQRFCDLLKRSGLGAERPRE